MVGIVFSYWGGLFSGARLVSGGVSVGCGPLPGFQWPPRWHYIFRFGDSELNLHLPLASWEGATPKISVLYNGLGVYTRFALRQKFQTYPPKCFFLKVITYGIESVKNNLKQTQTGCSELISLNEWSTYPTEKQGFNKALMETNG